MKLMVYYLKNSMKKDNHDY